ncbi:MAG: hypothetical protein IJ833_08495 [Lachnospiraceae bacterium]|nr:hypothetical protein [Lachnospiraceae bacterium]
MENKCIVFYESWQMECCGIPFTVGGTIKWLVYKTDYLNTPVDVGKIDYCYEAHSSKWTDLLVLEGKVDKIELLYEKYLPSVDNPRLLVPIGGKIIETESAKGFEKGIGDMRASGYIVTVSEHIIRPAEESEVTFK